MLNGFNDKAEGFDGPDMPIDYEEEKAGEKDDLQSENRLMPFDYK